MGRQQKHTIERELSKELIEMAGLATKYQNAIPKKLSVFLVDGDVMSIGSRGRALRLPALYLQLTGVERTFRLGNAIGMVLSNRFNPVVNRFLDDRTGSPDAYFFFIRIGSRYVALDLVRQVHKTHAADVLAHETRSELEESLTGFFPSYKAPAKVDLHDARLVTAGQLGMWFGTRLYQKYRGQRLEEFCALSKIKDVCALVPPLDAQPYLMKLRQWEESDKPSE
jgi:hypothetical protein